MYTILTAASTNREYTAGSGMPLPYKACAVGRVPQNLQLPMALAERRYRQGNFVQGMRSPVLPMIKRKAPKLESLRAQTVEKPAQLKASEGRKV